MMEMLKNPQLQQEWAESVKNNFMTADKNGNCKLNFEEFKHFMELQAKLEDEKFGGHAEFSEENLKDMWKNYQY